MKEINTGNKHNWKDTVEQLTQLPGEPAFDKTAAWEKLQKRLYKKTNTKKIIWYRLAAACLLAGFIAGAIFFTKQEPGIAVVVNQHKNKIEAVQQPSIIQKENKNNSINGILTDKNSTIQVAVKKDKKMIAASTSTTDLATVELTNLIQQEVPVTELQIVQHLNTDTAASFTATASAVNKKLKVVHINELGLPVGKETSVAQNHQLLFLQNNHLNIRSLVGNQYPEGNGNTTIFSIKLSSPK